MTYHAPIDDILFQLRLSAGADAFAPDGLLAELGDGVLERTLAEAAKFAESTLAPLNRIGDRVGVRFADGEVVTPPGWREAYANWRDSGWNALAAHPDDGGLGLPALLNAACRPSGRAALTTGIPIRVARCSSCEPPPSRF